MYRIGVDVGGTNTDCAILDITKPNTANRGVLISSKTPTTADITSGITKAVEDVLEKSRVAKKDVLSVTIGTTHFVNAVVEADERRLSKVAVVRLCGPATRAIPPFSDYPTVLRVIVDGGVYYLDGGLEIDGREILPLDLKQIRDTVDDIRRKGITKVALVGVFSPLDHAGVHEERCKTLMIEQYPDLDVVCSHSIGGVGLLERENATILNASILSVAERTANGFKRAMQKLELSCPLYLTQNDGTLTNADDAVKFPIKTFASGPTNSMIGAAFLAGLDQKGDSNEMGQVLVVDIGGTTTDICALLPTGFPRQAPNFVEVGGVRTAFSMPDVFSVGLGGGSRVEVGERVVVGPGSVGHHLTEKALVFGGDVLTTTDIVVAAGKAEIGTIRPKVSEEIMKGAKKQINTILQKAIDSMKVSNTPVTMILVGGGSILFMDELEGVAKCIIPPHHDSANAVGAAIAKVAGEIDVIEILDGKAEASVVEAAKKSAIAIAITKGAEIDDVKVVEVERLPLQYVTNKATRIRVKAVGILGSVRKAESEPLVFTSEQENIGEGEKRNSADNKAFVKPSQHIDIPSYRPDVQEGVWYLSEVDLEFIACGAGILGTGGGGSPYYGYLMSLGALRKGGKRSMKVVSPQFLKDDDVIAFCSWYGAPSVSVERLPAGIEIPLAIDAVNKIEGIKDFHGLLPVEIGGGNGLAAFPTSVHYGKPTIDGDMMGRAYPSGEHSEFEGWCFDVAKSIPVTAYVYGHKNIPCAMADVKGNVSVVMSADSNSRLEKMMRATCIELGLATSIVAAPLSGSAIKEYAIPNTISQSWYLGRAVHSARKSKTSFVTAIFDVLPGKLLYEGKIIDVTRDISKGYTVGRVLIAPLSSEEVISGTDVEKRHLVIPFQNEFLYAAYTNSMGKEETEVICTVPDLVSILGEDGEAIGSPELRYGLKVTVIGMPAHPLWTGDPRGLKVGGPEYFRLEMEWKSIGKYVKPRSVIEEFK